MRCIQDFTTNRSFFRKRPVVLCLGRRLWPCVLLLFLYGCSLSAFDRVPPAREPARVAALQKSLAEKALQAEQKKDLYLASLLWWLSANLARDDYQAMDRAKYLLTQSRSKAVASYREGLQLMENGQLNRSQPFFLTALAYDPQHAKALTALKQINEQKDIRIYRVTSAETLHSIVMREYRNKEMTAVIADYNDLSAYGLLQPGTDISLIVDEGPYRLEKAHQQPEILTGSKRVDSNLTNDILQKAKTSFAERNYRSAMALTRLILKDNENHAQARTLFNQSGYQMAVLLKERGNDREALELLEVIDADGQHVAALKKQLRQNLQNKAENHYREGVKFFLADKLTEARDEWEMALQLNPDHEKARKGLDKIEKILERTKPPR